jgi:tRNA(Glu) U13 pseudouridine synthase TruD
VYVSITRAPRSDLLARLAGHGQSRHAGKVLAQVEHVHAGLRLGDLLGREFLIRLHGRARVRLEDRLKLGSHHDRLPGGSVEPGGVPAGQFLAGVVGFAHEEISFE